MAPGVTEPDFGEARRQWRERHPGADPAMSGPPPFVAVAVTEPPAACYGEVGPARNGDTVDVTFHAMPECYLEGLDVWDTRVSPPEFVTWRNVSRKVARGETVTVTCGPEVTGPIIQQAMGTGFPW